MPVIALTGDDARRTEATARSKALITGPVKHTHGSFAVEPHPATEARRAGGRAGEAGYHGGPPRSGRRPHG
ncbi:hypothetical protein ACWGI9_37390 [Streptomyces sp. NPDC054833]